MGGDRFYLATLSSVLWAVKWAIFTFKDKKLGRRLKKQ
ncbi:hypothetical protein M23134_05148 [Microscilla marina ATCC 23134]|uniref:Uncharacterized protein n=1 Tax=Microscilla marina ATCC 23134 TaxID=313606 RepID=A1ZDA3_MICM2|nr:hypothetical protein M23134_05148 [Microscilla marina ATCC 23134]